MSADNPVLLSHDAETKYGKSIRIVIDRELSDKEKKRLTKGDFKYWIIAKMCIDGNGKLLFVELSSDWLIEEKVSAKHIANILHQIKPIPNGIRPFQENGYIQYTVIRR